MKEAVVIGGHCTKYTGIQDRGGSFGGLIYSLLSGKDTQEAVEFAVAASTLLPG